MNPPPLSAESAALLQMLVEEYAECLRAGAEPDRYAFVQRHPALAAALEPHLEAAEALFALGRPAAPPAEVPAFIGRYRIEQVLGRGAASVVYRAFDPKHERPVALKVFAGPVLTSAAVPDRFHRDALIAARLRHPNIVPLHDSGAHAGFRYLDMELVEGNTLEHALQRQTTPWAPRAAAELARTMALALDYAHRQGVVHRDVKPSNILLDADGTPQLTDFDLARELGTQSLAAQTAQGQLLGTPHYMSPEQAEGRAHQADARSDVYSLGVVLYRLLTGQLPFDERGSLTVLLAAITHAEPARPRRLQPTVPHDLERICLKALEKAPADRFASAEALADELGRFLRDEPLRFRPPALGERLRRWVRRNRAAAGLSAAAALLAVALAVLGWAEYRRRFEATVRARLEDDNEVLQGQIADKVAQTLLRTAELRLRVTSASRRAETQELLREAARLRARYSTAPLPSATRLELRALLALSLAFPDVEPLEMAALPDNQFDFWPVALHPDGDRMVIGTPTGLLRWQRGTALTVPDQLDKQAPRCRPFYSSDGRWLVLARADGGLAVYDGAAPAQPLASRAGPVVLAVNFVDDALLACDASGCVTRATLPNLAPLGQWQLEAPKASELSVAAISAKTGRLAVGTRHGWVARYCTDGARLGTAQAAESAVDALAWSPDGQALAIGTRDGTVQFWEADGKPRHHWHYSAAGVGRLGFTPDSRYLLAGQRFSRGRGWDVLNGQEVLAHRFAIAGFARDRARLALTAPGRVGFAQWRPAEGLELLAGHRSLIAATAWSRDATRLASVDTDGEIRVWDVATRRTIQRLVGPPPGFYSDNVGLALSDDGALLAYAPGGTESCLQLHDVKSRRRLANWPLPAGYDRLVCTGGQRFLSVREDRLPGGKATQTMGRIVADGRLSAPTVLRRPRPGDVGFFELNVAPDGKRCCWIGPRNATSALRVEVYDVDTQRPLHVVPLERGPDNAHRNARLSHGGRYLWYDAGPRKLRLDLELGSQSVVALLPLPAGACGNALILPNNGPQRNNERRRNVDNGILVQRAGDAEPWLELRGLGEDPLTGVAAEPSGRYLSMGGRDVVTLADLHILQARIAAFEQTLAAP